MSCRPVGLVRALLLSSGASLPQQSAAQADLLAGNGVMALTLEAPLREIFVAKSDVRVYLDAARSREACKPNEFVSPGTPVNELPRSGAMSQVVILDAKWRWTSEQRCETVQDGPVWVQSDSITKDYPSNN